MSGGALKKITYAAISVIVATGLVAGVSPAHAVTTEPLGTQGSGAPSISSTRYSDFDIVKFFFFGSGPVANQRPDLVKALQIPSQPDVPDSVVTTVLAGLKSVDSAFNANVTTKAQSRDPYKAEAAFKQLVADAKALSDKMSKKAPATPSAKAGANGWWYAYANVWLSTTVAATAGLAVSVIAVAGALVVFLYEEPTDSSDLAQQNFVSALTTL